MALANAEVFFFNSPHVSAQIAALPIYCITMYYSTCLSSSIPRHRLDHKCLIVSLCILLSTLRSLYASSLLQVVHHGRGCAHGHPRPTPISDHRHLARAQLEWSSEVSRFAQRKVTTAHSWYKWWLELGFGNDRNSCLAIVIGFKNEHVKPKGA